MPKTKKSKRKKRRSGFHHLDRRADQLANAAEGPLDQLIDTRTLCRWLGMSQQWAEIARHKSKGPKFIRLGHRRIRYRRGDVVAWLRERTHRGTAEYRK